jgi:hypothetical protein
MVDKIKHFKKFIKSENIINKKFGNPINNSVKEI